MDTRDVYMVWLVLYAISIYAHIHSSYVHFVGSIFRFIVCSVGLHKFFLIVTSL